MLPEDALDRVHVIRRNGRTHAPADVEYESNGLVGTARIQVPPVHEVPAAPDPPTAYLAVSGERERLDTLDG
jgi:hypothetical protein